MATDRKRRYRWPHLTRDGLLFTTGLAFAVNEVIVRDGPERPSVLILIAGMMGLPAVLLSIQKQQGERS